MNIKNILYLLIIFSLFLFLFGIIVYIISLIYSSIKGSPYVPTSKKLLKKFFGEIKFKKNSFFIELGSGDGRILRYIAKYYQINGLGVDINPILVWFSKVYSWLENVNDRVKFERMDAMNVDLTKADYIYIFLMPKFIKKLRLKMEKELKKGVIVISHGFKIDNWDNKLFKILKNKPFNTYFYRF